MRHATPQPAAQPRRVSTLTPRLAAARREQDVPEREGGSVSKKKRRTEFENELPPEAKAPPHAGKVMREGSAETASVRAKASGHRKKTADEWNQ
jgi:hypothetical protein